MEQHNTEPNNRKQLNPRRSQSKDYVDQFFNDDGSYPSDNDDNNNNNTHRTTNARLIVSDRNVVYDTCNTNQPLAPPVLVYHESARSIVFRDQIRRAAASNSTTNKNNASTSTSPMNAFTPVTDGTPTVVEDTHTRQHHHHQRNASNISDDHSASSVSTTNQQTRTRKKKVDNFHEIAKLINPDHSNVKLAEKGVPATQIAGYTPTIVPLQSFELGPNDIFHDLLNSTYNCAATEDNNTLSFDERSIVENSSSNNNKITNIFSDAEIEVVEMLHNQRCCVKTIKNTDWTAFIDRFHFPHKRTSKQTLHDDIPPTRKMESNNDDNNNKSRCFNSFVTSTTLLPPNGKKMRAFGSTSQYTTGVVFALPRSNDYDLYDYVGNDDGADYLTEITAYESAEQDASLKTETWSWPAGYSAKTEFNIDSNGKLINGRQEAIRNLTTLRSYNIDYCTKDHYIIANRTVSGLSQIPYNEVFLRVGGYGRLVRGYDVSTINSTTSNKPVLVKRSFSYGVGLPVALFVRTAKYGDLISMLRTRARLQSTIGEKHIKNIPLLLIDPEIGVRVLTEQLQHTLWKIASNILNPFQNQTIVHRTTIDRTDDEIAFQQKVDELIEFDESIQSILTPEELVRIAGGFGATDASVATLFKQVFDLDQKINKEKQLQQQQQIEEDELRIKKSSSNSKHSENDNDNDDNDDDDDMSSIGEGGAGGGCIEASHHLQDVVNEGLTAAVRAGDYYTSRQLLILYSLVAAKQYDEIEDDDDDDEINNEIEENDNNKNFHYSDDHPTDLIDKKEMVEVKAPPSTDVDNHTQQMTNVPKRSDAFEKASRQSFKQMESDVKTLVVSKKKNESKLSNPYLHTPSLPPPPPLDTDRLRSATNSDGLLAVLGAAEVLKAMRTGTAQRRTMEAVAAVEEWVDYGEQSMAFRISSWYDQRAAQGDLQIATETNTNFMAFVSNKAISNRRTFAQQLRDAASQTDFTDIRFLQAVDTILQKMNSPCLRLELLQYMLGLDNRYSVAHVRRSVELAATCLKVSSSSVSRGGIPTSIIQHPHNNTNTRHGTKGLLRLELHNRTKTM
jgi:hypothetical protein